jgi:sigma-B regulation protein RsbU (phosphoserine phosphatase)
VTFITAVLDATNGAVTLVNAGHCAPLVYRRSSGAVEEAMPIEKTGVPLGVLEMPVYGACSIVINAGDSLIFYTDGVTDALNPSQHQFKLEGILSALRGPGPSTPKALVERLVKAVEQHAAGHPQYDDITLVAFGQTPAPGV